MIDFSKYAQTFSLPESEVKTKIAEYQKKIVAEIKEYFSDEESLNKKVEELTISNISKIFVLPAFQYAKKEAEKGNLKEISCIIYGVGPTEDRNDFDKRQARNMYYEDLKNGTDTSIKNGMVRIRKTEDGRKYPIPLYHEKVTKDKDGNEIPNPRHGQDIPYDGQKRLVMVVSSMGDNEIESFELGNIRWDKDCSHSPRVACKSIVYGNKYGKTVSVSKDAYEDLGEYEQAWSVANRVLPKTEYWKELIDVISPETKPYTMFITRGNVARVQEGDNSKYSLRITAVDVPDGIKLSTRYVPVGKDIMKFQTGDEVIVIGKKMNFKNNDNQIIDYYQLWGAVRNTGGEEDEMRQKLKDARLI